MVDFSDNEAWQDWLSNQPAEVSIVLATRAAARVLPMMFNKEGNEKTIDVVISVFRSIYNARFHVIYNRPIRGKRLIASYAGHAAAMVEYLTEDFEKIEYARVGLESTNAIIHSINVISAAPARFGGKKPHSDAIKCAFAYIENDINNNNDVGFPLWPDNIEEINSLKELGISLRKMTKISWVQLRDFLLSRPNENWQVWTDWYDAWLDGRPVYAEVAPARREQLEFDICLIPDADWKQGPAHVNAIIARLIAEAAAEGEVDEEALPKQTSNAATYGPNARGQMAHLPVTGEHRLSDLTDVRFFYTEARDLAAELHQLGLQFLGETVHKCAARMCEALPEDAQAAIEREVWAAGNALRRKLSAHDAVAPLNEPHPDLLEKGAVERLRSFTEAFNQLAFADPKLRARDERRPGPQETRDARAEMRVIAPVARQAASDEAITTPAVAADLRVAAEEARATDEGVVGRLGAEQARDTLRNFEAATLVAVYRTLRAVKRIAQGDGGFITKETFSGAYKALGAGAMGAVGLVLSGNANWLVGWETVQHIASNLQALRVYAPLAFQSSPSVRPLLDYIEATVEIEDRKKGAKPR